MIVLLDTGILLRLVDRNDPLHPSVRAAVRAIKVRGDTLTMTAQNVAECVDVKPRGLCPFRWNHSDRSEHGEFTNALRKPR